MKNKQQKSQPFSSSNTFTSLILKDFFLGLIKFKFFILSGKLDNVSSGSRLSKGQEKFADKALVPYSSTVSRPFT